MKKRKHGRELVFVGVILILVLMMLYSGLRILESTVLYREQDQVDTFVSKTITREKVGYFPRQDITTVLVMGIDKYGPVEKSDVYNNTGASDLNMVLIFDEVNEVCNILHLNPDTMVEMPVLDIDGKPAGTCYGQLALAHTFGTGLSDSCENVRKTVSDFLHGVEIDYYVAMHMDAIAILNDAVGGITVNVSEDFSSVDPAIGIGEVKLMGEHAIHYVRAGTETSDQKNISRIQRQQKYLDGFIAAFREKQSSDYEWIINAYEQAQPYMVTDCSANAISGMADRFSGYRINEVAIPEGQNVPGKEGFEFYVDAEKLDALILRLFYAPKG